MLINAEQDTLCVRQIAGHLQTRPWNITNELSLGAQGYAGRLRGTKTTGPGRRGAGGQWSVDRTVYLNWLGVPAEDREHLGADGLPVLYTEEDAAKELGLRAEELLPPEAQVRRALLRLPLTHVTVGWRRYLTHSQLERLRALLAQELPG